MSSLPADLLIWAMLVIGTAFCGLGLMGLMIFPDTRSRMFTAFRATAIGLGAVVVAVLVYAYTLFMTTGGEQYLALVLRTLILAFVLAAGTWMMYGIIRERTHWQKPGSADKAPARPEAATKKDGE
jgi:multisubunit Na+/H+ antiporter MnhG subunit